MSAAASVLDAAELRLRGSRVLIGGGSLAQSVGNARQVWSARRGLLFELWDQDGSVGIGEASPLPGHSRSTLEDCVRVLSALSHPRQQITGFDQEGWPLIPSLDAYPEARFAFETALCDLISRRRSVSVATLLGGQEHAQIPRNALISTMQQARAAVLRGITTLKIKVGSGQATEQERQKEADKELLFLQQLRDELGHSVTLRLDANGVYSPALAHKRLADFARYQIALIEQPTSAAELATLGACAIPWAADESLSEPVPDAATGADPVAALLRAPGCCAFVIKPALHGLRAARRLALRAQAQGLGVIVTHLVDGPVALAAACELALSLPGNPLPCGLDRHAGLSAWTPVDIPQHRQAEHLITPSGGAGLGFARPGVPWC